MNSVKTVFDKQITRRDSNIELFRIITMIAIVAHHLVVNSGLLEVMYNDSLNSKSIFLFIFGAWGKIGINCFVFITGYFMCKSNITVRKFAKLLFEVLFYNISIGFIFLATGYESLSVTSIIKLFIPVNYVSWFIVLYFISSYVRLYSKVHHN